MPRLENRHEISGSTPSPSNPYSRGREVVFTLFSRERIGELVVGLGTVAAISILAIPGIKKTFGESNPRENCSEATQVLMTYGTPSEVTDQVTNLYPTSALSADDKKVIAAQLNPILSKSAPNTADTFRVVMPTSCE